MNKLAHNIQQSNTGDSVARRRFSHTLLGLVLFSTLSIALAQSQQFEEDFDDENNPWEEITIQLPAAPKPENLLPFYVSPTATQKFAVDSTSISVGKDGVVRYTLVSTSTEGAKNISYEGIRCATFEKKIYALGQDNSNWTRSRRDQWEMIVRGGANRQHAALALDYFCSNLTVAGNEQAMVKRIKTKKTLTDDLLRN
jgi:hypothetical protein